MTSLLGLSNVPPRIFCLGVQCKRLLPLLFHHKVIPVSEKNKSCDNAFIYFCRLKVQMLSGIKMSPKLVAKNEIVSCYWAHWAQWVLYLTICTTAKCKTYGTKYELLINKSTSN